MYMTNVLQELGMCQLAIQLPWSQYNQLFLYVLLHDFDWG